MWLHKCYTFSREGTLQSGVQGPVSCLPEETRDLIIGVSECWMFYAVLTARVNFMEKTSLDVFSLSQEQVWTFSVLGDRIYEMRCLFVAVGPNVTGTHGIPPSQAHHLENCVPGIMSLYPLWY